MNPLRVTLVLPPARVSHEIDTIRAMPGVELTQVAGHGCTASEIDGHAHVIRVPWFGATERCAPALAWTVGVPKRAQDPDLLLSYELCSPTSWQAGLLARRLGVPHAVMMAENRANNLVYRLPPWKQLAQARVASASAFIGITETAREHAIARGADPDRCYVVHPGIDIARFRPAPTLEPSPTIVFMGQLRANIGADKGLVETVLACDIVATEHRDLRLNIIGDGHLRSALDELAQSRPWMTVRSGIARAEVPEVLRTARCMVLAAKPTAKSGGQFGFSIVEAMASGLPVVVTDTGALPEVAGLANPIARSGDVRDLAEKLSRALSSEGDQIGQANRKRAIDNFSVDGQGARLATLLRQIAVGGQSIS